MASVADIIRAAAQRYGEDPETLLRIAGIESKFDPNAANPRSSARGLFQFVAPTWRQYGNGADPLNPEANADAGARFLRDNRAALRNGLNRDPTPGEMYLAHQQGAGAAVNMLRDQNKVVGGDAIRLNGGSDGMTAGEFSRLWTSRFDGAGGPTTTGPQMADAAQTTPQRRESPVDFASIADVFQQQAAAQMPLMDPRKRPHRPLFL